MACNGVLELVFIKIFIGAVPGPEITPSKRGRYHIYVIRFFHHTKVNGNTWAEGIDLLQRLFFLGSIKTILLRREQFKHFRKIFFKSDEYIFYPPHENTRVP